MGLSLSPIYFNIIVEVGCIFFGLAVMLMQLHLQICVLREWQQLGVNR